MLQATEPPRPAANRPATAPVILFDGAHLQLIYLPGPAPLTLLTFDIMHARANGRKAFGIQLCQKNGFSLLGVVPKHPCWYPAVEIEQIAPICRALVRGSTIAYGASMGAYGALRWGKYLGADHALACSPQASIDPEVTGTFDRRYGAFYQAALHRDMQVLDSHIPHGSVALYDPRFNQDRFQTGLLAGMQNLTAIKLPHMGHGTARCIAGSANATAMFQLLMQNDIPALRRRALQQRKTGDTYRLQLASTALRRKRPDLAQRLAEPTRTGSPIPYHMLMGRRAMTLGEPDAARSHYQQVLALHPPHRIAQIRLAQLSEREAVT